MGLVQLVLKAHGTEMLGGGWSAIVAAMMASSSGLNCVFVLHHSMLSLDGQVFVGRYPNLFVSGATCCVCVNRPSSTQRASGLGLVGQLCCPPLVHAAVFGGWLMSLGARCWFGLNSLVLGHCVIPMRSNSADLVQGGGRQSVCMVVCGRSAEEEKLCSLGDIVTCVHHSYGSLDSSDGSQGQGCFS